MGIPLVALQSQPPPDPLSQYGKAVQIANLLQQQKLLPGQLQQQQQQIQATGLENQQRQMEVGQTQAINKAYSDALSVDQNGQPSIDQDKLQKSLATSGHGAAIPGILKNTADYQKSFADAAKAQLEVQTNMTDAMGSVGKAIQSADYDPGVADLLLQHQLATPNLPAAYKQQLAQTEQQLKANPGMVKQIADQLVAGSVKQQAFTNALQVAEVRANTPEARELNAALTNGTIKDPSEWPAYKAAQSAAAETPVKISQAQQMATAELPIRVAQAGQEASARLGVENSPAAIQGAANKAAQVEISKANALAPTLDQATKTTASGQKYLDMTNLKGPEAELLSKQALAAGIPLADKSTSTALSAIDTARQNQQFMLDQIGKKLASGAPSRLWYGPANTIEKMAQTDPTMAAIGDYRSAAIQSMRAVAGSGGLRINQAEIKQATDNDIPNLTDTLPVAQQKLKNMQAFLDHTESGLLTKDRSTPTVNPKTSIQVGQSVKLKNGTTVTVKRVYPDGSFD